MYNIILCDDDITILNQYQDIIRNISKSYFIKTHIETYQSSEQLLFHVESRPGDPDIIFLDIQMKDIDGILAAEKLRKLKCYAKIIFLTNYPQYVFRSFKANPYHYLIKETTTFDQFKNIFLDVIKLCQNAYSNSFFIKTKNSLIRLKIKDISYIEVRDHQIEAHTDDKSYSFTGIFKELCSRFSPYGFLQISRCSLVNPNHINIMHNQTMIMESGQQLIIARRYYKQIKSSLENQFF